MKQLKILSINISKDKGTVKYPVSEAFLSFTGITGDAHAGLWHRQVSMLAIESIRRFENVLNRKIEVGEFAENLTTEGFDLLETKPLDIFEGNEVVLQVTQIGKSCHGNGCSIFRQVGKCVMPTEGIFLKVLKQGNLKVGDILTFKPKVYKCKIITLSTRAYHGIYEDRSGPAIIQYLENYFNEKKLLHKIDYELIPDDAELLKNSIIKLVDENYDFLLTTGGTGISKNDITVDTIQPMLEKEIPGIMEYIRIKYGSNKPQALLSRGVAGIIKNTVVFTLPGSVKAVNEYMVEILPHFQHIGYMLNGIDSH
jgi:molybdenum cofactor synthesis domain-containing protein